MVAKTLSAVHGLVGWALQGDVGACELSNVWSTCFAIGAATRPPVTSALLDPPCSTSTAIAYFGWSAGANAMNHACGFSPVTVSAVPVLPATLTPGICAAVPVPPGSSTTACMNVVMVAAVVGSIARLYC